MKTGDANRKLDRELSKAAGGCAIERMSRELASGKFKIGVKETVLVKFETPAPQK